MRLQIRTILVVLVVLVLGLPGAAQASGNDVIRDCAADGQLNKKYSQRELEEAERNLPSDIDEYTDCRQAIRSAMSGGSGKKGTPIPGGILTPSGAVAGAPEDVAALEALSKDAAKGKRASVRIGDQVVVPGNASLGGLLGGLAGANGMPSSLIVAIAALAVLAVVTAYLAAREKAPRVWHVTSRFLGR